jgi:protein YIPF1/2
MALHAGLAIAIKILFFAHGSPAAKGDNAGNGLPDPIGDGAQGDDAARMLFGP